MINITESEYRRLLATGKVSGQPLTMPKNKYRNIKVYVTEDGCSYSSKSQATSHGRISMVFDSEKEYSRYCELILLQKVGKIHGLSRQKKYVICEKFRYKEETVGEIYYKADFHYMINDETYVEDVKPLDVNTGKYRLTKDFSLKWKLLKKQYPNINFVLY